MQTDDTASPAPPAQAAPPVPLARLGAVERGRLHALNNAHAEMLSWLDRDAWEALAARATVALSTADAAGFMLAFDEGAGYASPNFRWFVAQGGRFLYVDRVVVRPEARGRGLARAFYAALERYAHEAGRGRIVCEVNRVPPNPGSDAFHAALGFVEVGRGEPAPGKVVRYLERRL